MSDEYGLNLGHGTAGPLSISKVARDVHMQVVGLSRQGKSYFLEHLIRQDITNGAGVCVIDPHGEMFGNLVDWCAANNMHRRRRIHLISPADGLHAVGFNPLSRDDDRVNARVDAMIEACQKVWDDSESTGHKTLAKLLNMVFATLAHHRLSLREATLLTNLDYSEVRERLVNETGDHDLIAAWREITTLPPREIVAQFQAVTNRLMAMNRSEGIAQMLGQTEGTLDFKQCMEEGHVVLVNLAHYGKIPPSVAQTVGALITADLFHSATCRDVVEAENNPFYCYIDECGDYLTAPIVKALDQTAKFGLHYILSHQGVDQLGKEPSDPIRRGVMRGAQNKIVFLQDDEVSAREFADLLFGKSYDLERPKEILIKPSVVGFDREWLRSEAEGQGHFAASGSGSSAGMSAGLSMMDIDGATATVFEGTSDGTTWMESSGASHSYSQGRSEALIPILKDLPTGVYSLEELRHLAVNEIRLLQKRQAFAYRADDRIAQQFATANIFPARPTAEQIEEFFKVITGREESVKTVERVENDVQARRQRLIGHDPGPDDTPSFFHPD